MSVDHRFQQVFTEISQMRQKLRDSDNGGTSGGMEERIAKLESDMAHVKESLKEIRSDLRTTSSDVSTLKSDVATVKENLRHLPTQTWLFKAMAGMVGAMGVIVAVIVRFLPAAH